MDKEELKKLLENLNNRVKEIDNELASIATENPLVRGDFNVRVEDVGQSQEDAAQEAGELDRQQALVNTLETERKDVITTINKIKSGEYGRCEKCSTDINPARLRAMPAALFCIGCAKKTRF
ncbi:MAG: hypothetical protein A3B91_00230 [Candidatus Yanofskybacteria bacterium RIFCSPHIGHO2_02_FULL_41_29]|uniref:Zinc finger DksA/TraR C4-type domain-containing protein n=1 Tax=Candidatus Yanofskybacteria bacterium RIFCSPHIGHO2_01_FULL_41_53 TaxID=1802663 RepID=A0A1F8EJB2_9BACT|nr:MAG: hypothetical protein A2650_03285 [Candidatus Yanofskybacteria bacterium RIFCSPHIGHO2_01_FULL_41_53]OGN10550.1 MAG: hypothetical protein A3B91_00230 [Candidatus Yanofskybacteria bacterium RIFCSPHIGHO2_02_FULL_41_29]OGN17952.1 MAG: hypothetical protein A3F48_04590 [Candidatus Yanofskybacteria bacterium RIFCSPHIGHO2_12_FULL_41_9]OGN21697.1 MAG: hypothetical protein A2916_04005 [Candidatus Yanofskybacteria bacterium RIFCSPLOWO2_01_FULL_41_67]OGN29211.1 MAG: hypothetical protein A3H54_03480 